MDDHNTHDTNEQAARSEGRRPAESAIVQTDPSERSPASAEALGGGSPPDRGRLASLTNDTLEAEITTLAAHIAAAECRWLELIAEFDRRGAWAGIGVRSCAHWLNWRCGLSRSAARERVRVAHALQRLPLVRAAFAAGQLSYSKVRAITRVANSATETALVEMARAGTASHLDRIASAFRRSSTADAVRADLARHVTWRYDADGNLVINATIPGDAAAIVLAAFRVLTGTPSSQDVAEFVEEPASAEAPSLAARRADALVEMAETILARHHRGPAERPHVVAHVTAGSLAGADDGDADVDSAPIASAVARRLACDAELTVVAEGSKGQVLDLGRSRRRVSRRLRRALRTRDRGCRFPGCTSQQFVDAHHVRHWVDGGSTDLANLVTLCRRHHRLVHEHGYTVEAPDGAAAGSDVPGWQFRRPDGSLVVAGVLPGGSAEAVDGAAGKAANAHTIEPTWTGERLDMNLALTALHRARHT